MNINTIGSLANTGVSIKKRFGKWEKFMGFANGMIYQMLHI